jgi:hypothetical protein
VHDKEQFVNPVSVLELNVIAIVDDVTIILYTG